MWLWPISVTLKIERTRNSWTLCLRVHFFL